MQTNDFDFVETKLDKARFTPPQSGVNRINNEVYQHFQIRSTEADVNDRVQPDVLFSMMQETAYSHVNLAGLAAQFTDEKNVCWLLNAYTLRLNKVLRWQDRLTCKTWVRPIDKLFFHREFGLYDHLGDRFGLCTSTWFLADSDSHAPLRPNVLGKEDASYAGVNEPIFGVNALRIRKPVLEVTSGMKPQIRRTVAYSDLDRNGHVNNTRYILWSVDAVHEYGLAADQSPSGIDISFIAEAKYGDNVELYVKPVERAVIDASNKDFVPAAGELSFAIEGVDANGHTMFRCYAHFQ